MDGYFFLRETPSGRPEPYHILSVADNEAYSTLKGPTPLRQLVAWYARGRVTFQEPKLDNLYAGHTLTILPVPSINTNTGSHPSTVPSSTNRGGSIEVSTVLSTNMRWQLNLPGTGETIIFHFTMAPDVAVAFSRQLEERAKHGALLPGNSKDPSVSIGKWTAETFVDILNPDNPITIVAKRMSWCSLRFEEANCQICGVSDRALTIQSKLIFIRRATRIKWFPEWDVSVFAHERYFSNKSETSVKIDSRRGGEAEE